ncbi:MAG: LacI family DNA-binding transcriptional regulator [Planctomycetota bacterium]
MRGRPERNKQVSIEQVARRAGVSTATVSRVLNSPSKVTANTAERVHEAISELRYRPNMFAKGLMTRQSKVIALVLPDIHGEFYSELLRGADEAADELGYHLLASSRMPFDVSDRPAAAGFGLLDGLIVMVPTTSQDQLVLLGDLNMPIVAIDRDLTDHGFDSVLIDNSVGAGQAADHLLAATPPERCVYVGGDQENVDSMERSEAFRAALRRRGAEPAPDQIVFGRYTASYGERWAKEQGESLRGRAVLAGNDEIALGIIAAAGELGIMIPEELRVIGFDNIRLATLIRPKLSSVGIPLKTIGDQAVRMLIERLDDTEAAPRRVEFPTDLIARETS